MTVQGARAILGEDIAQLTDIEVEQLIGSTKQMCRAMIKTIVTKKEALDMKIN